MQPTMHSRHTVILPQPIRVTCLLASKLHMLGMKACFHETLKVAMRR